jgi:hypothetical protein
MKRVFLLLVLGFSIFAADRSMAQHAMKTVGVHFSFGIIEGPESLSAATANLILTVLSPYNGTGSITSPSGYSQTFSFSPMKAVKIKLPESLLHLHDNGKTNKGLLVTTSQPVCLTLHDDVVAAGDATQLYPDDALDTDYYCPNWGVWDDSEGEANHSQILVTASADNTMVVIIPSAMTIAGDSAKKPIEVTLNAGECYILKCDTSHGGAKAGLSGTTVIASKPVSVIVGTTCAFVPGLPIESCNELMDEITGRSHWGQTFYVAPFGNGDTTDVVMLLTGAGPFFYWVNDLLGTSNGRSVIYFKGPARIEASEFIYVQQLAKGSELELNGLSDPTMVTVLDSTSWSDTLLWQTPPASAQESFTHYVSLVYPLSSQSQIFLDGRSLDSLQPSQSLIEGSIMRSVVKQIDSGAHIITSPVPVFAVANGWSIADGYSFLPGTMGSFPPLEVTRAETSPLKIAVIPNPAVGPITFAVNVPNSARTRIKIDNLLGQTVAWLFDGELGGVLSFEWNPDGSAAGLYECVMEAGNQVVVRQIAISK